LLPCGIHSSAKAQDPDQAERKIGCADLPVSPEMEHDDRWTRITPAFRSWFLRWCVLADALPFRHPLMQSGIAASKFQTALWSALLCRMTIRPLLRDDK
jgi:hypothetical protein